MCDDHHDLKQILGHDKSLLQTHFINKYEIVQQVNDSSKLIRNQKGNYIGHSLIIMVTLLQKLMFMTLHLMSLSKQCHHSIML